MLKKNEYKIPLSILDKKFKKKFYIFFLITFFSVFLEAISIGSLYPFLSVLFTGNLPLEGFFQKFFSIFYSKEVLEDFPILAILTFAVILFVIKNLYIIFTKIWQENLLKNLRLETYNKILSYYLSEKYTFHINTNSSILIRNLKFGIDHVVVTISQLMVLASEVLIFISIFIVLAIIEIKTLLYIVLFILLPAIIFGYFLKKYVGYWGTRSAKYSATSLKHLLQALSSFKEIKIFQKEKFFLDAFLKPENEYQIINRNITVIKNLPKILFEILLIFSIFLFFAYDLFAQEQSINSVIPTVGIFVIGALRIIPSASKILFAINSIKKNEKLSKIVAAEIMKYNQNIDIIKPFYEDKLNHNHNIFQKNIILKKITFGYSNENILIQDLDLEINKGEFIGIFGDSGSGKSTLADIILGFFEPNHGDVIIDDIKKKITTDFWKTKIGYVPQEVNLLDDTILKNITYQLEDKNIDQEALKKAINQSQLQNFIKESKSGINTIIGEKGFKISGGQRQRIGIARAIYNNPEIIIFDESTSSLDKEAESNLLNSIYSLKNKVTVIFISHDLNLLSRCDSVYKLQDKKLIKS